MLDTLKEAAMARVLEALPPTSSKPAVRWQSSKTGRRALRKWMPLTAWRLVHGLQASLEIAQQTLRAARRSPGMPAGPAPSRHRRVGSRRPCPRAPSPSPHPPCRTDVRSAASRHPLARRAPLRAAGRGLQRAGGLRLGRKRPRLLAPTRKERICSISCISSGESSHSLAFTLCCSCAPM